MLVVLVFVAACGSDSSCPSDESWRAGWESQQALVPTADDLLAGGSDLCGELVGEFRSSRDELLPTPTEALDAAVETWIADVEGMVFDCSSDRAILEDQLVALDVLVAEIDAGLIADEGG